MYPHVTYFPSYEIITSPNSAGRYFEDDLREVKPVGVDHVMRIFKKHFVEAKVIAHKAIGSDAPVESVQDIICDEEEIMRSLHVSGIKPS
jgi:citrate lyase synthetase